MDWTTIFNIIGFSNGLFLSFIILRYKKGNKTTTRWLAALIGVLSLFVAILVMNVTHFYLKFPHLIRSLTPLYFALGPFLFFYVKALTNERLSLKKSYWFHFFPFALQIIYNIPFYLKSAEFKINFYRYFLIHPDRGYQVSMLLKFVHPFIYLLWTIGLLKRHSAEIKESFASLEKVKLDWLRGLVIAVASALAAYFMFALLRMYTYNEVFLIELRKIFYVSGSVLIYFLGYKGFTQPDILLEKGKKTSVKYSHSTLAQEQASKYQRDLLSFMESEKPHLESDLTIKSLAARVRIPYFHLSQVINERLHQNFFDFINRYRVEEAKTMLNRNKKRRKVTILFIAYECGFNSKPSFNRAFKKHTGMTPSQFLNKA